MISDETRAKSRRLYYAERWKIGTISVSRPATARGQGALFQAARRDGTDNRSRNVGKHSSRGHWSPTRAQWVIAELKRSGLSPKKFAARYKVGLKRIYYWRARLEAQGSPTQGPHRLIEVRFVGAEGSECIAIDLCTSAHRDRVAERQATERCGVSRSGAVGQADRRAGGTVMLSMPPSVRLFIATQVVDGRKGPDSLLALVRDVLGQDIFDGHLFIFFTRRRDRVRIVYWDRNGTAAAPLAASSSR